jgi:NAD(P)-dependent dehydrogenase (short-subunit alcohol dehydrogenase family)
MKGLRIVVTGAARGIGQALAADLRERGASVVTLDVNPVGVDHECDISDPERVEAVFEAVGEIDGLVNNAAYLVDRKRFEDIELDEWNRMLAVNLTGTFLCTRAAAKRMPRGGAIVNLASETAFTGSHGFVHYVASKGAVVAMTRALARELGADRITVNAIAPGLILSDTVQANPDITGFQLAGIMQARSLKREAFPDDVEGTAVFLASDDSAFMTGQTLIVDGGSVFSAI